MLWDEGFWEPLGDVEAGLRDGELKFVLDGRRLKGAWVLVRLKPKAGEHGDNWLLIKEKDGHVQDEARHRRLRHERAHGPHQWTR